MPGRSSPVIGSSATWKAAGARATEGRWPARWGDDRIIYRIDEAAMTLYVLKIGRRARVYRQ